MLQMRVSTLSDPYIFDQLIHPCLDMFRGLRTSNLPQGAVYSVKIGGNPTEADWYLSDPEEVIATIMALNGEILAG